MLQLSLCCLHPTFLTHTHAHTCKCYQVSPPAVAVTQGPPAASRRAAGAPGYEAERERIKHIEIRERHQYVNSGASSDHTVVLHKHLGGLKRWEKLIVGRVSVFFRLALAQSSCLRKHSTSLQVFKRCERRSQQWRTAGYKLMLSKAGSPTRALLLLFRSGL